ncbi:MAG: AmmeMemoRadiSam system protein A [Peptococcaceae bacterium]|nr:AmmeMemoRadiSam system protein A [Peptococcaceae bacterium]
MSLVYVGFAPHPPIAVPQVGRGEEEKCRATLAGMDTLAKAVCDSGAEILLVVSPHAPSDGESLSFLESIDGRLEGDFSAFGAGDVRFSWETVPEIIGALRELGGRGVRARLDHGVMVPLYFLERAGWRGRLVVVAAPQVWADVTPRLWGERIAAMLEALPQRCGILASGDLSHRLKEEGPYGFHPSGPRFDELIVRGLQTEPDILGSLPEILVEEAGQCGYASLLLALGARKGACRVLSYEGPFGIGYLTAELYRSSPVAGYARACLCRYVEGSRGDETEIPGDPLLKTERSCFVTLYKEGDLRGCIGTIKPVRPSLADEIRHNAVAAAVQDSRFRPVEADELPLITVSVDVLGDLEVAEVAELDPYLYGVVVGSRGRTGLLLPRLAGVDTVAEQLAIARQKAGILPDEEDVEIWRFQVDRYFE